jgi:hypothetical protein
MPEFCRHGRFLQNCRICNPRKQAGPGRSSEPRSAPAPGRAGPRGGTGRRGGRGASAVVVRRVARAVEDGYASELVPGLNASGDARRLAAELAFSTARLAELATDPPGLYADAALAPDREEGLWLAFQIAHLSPAGGGAPFAAIAAARTTWASGEPPAIAEGAGLGPRTTVDLRDPSRTAGAYRAWAGRSGSQAAALAADPEWTPQRRFARIFERLALPGLARAGRFELLTSLGRLGLVDLDAGELRLGDSADGATVAAKRVFGIGDAILLERRAVGLAEATGVPLAALDLALFNFSRADGERAMMGSRAAPDPSLCAAIEDALGLAPAD